MIDKVVQRDFVQGQLDALRRHIAGSGDDEVIAAASDVVAGARTDDAAARLLAAMPIGTPGPPSSGVPADEADDVPFIGRDPVTALVQTAMEQRLLDRHEED